MTSIIKIKRYLIWVNSVVAGFEVVSCVTLSIIPPLLLKSGYSETQMAALFGVGPLIALWSTPAFGKWSDSCVSPYGRRRPFIMGFSLVIIASLFFILGAYDMIKSSNEILKSFGGWILGLSVIILDFSCQVAFNPCQSLNADIIASLPSESPLKTNGFVVYSGMASFGCCLGYAICSINWSQLFPGQILSGEKVELQIVLVLIFILTYLTITSTKEKVQPQSKWGKASTELEAGLKMEQETLNIECDTIYVIKKFAMTCIYPLLFFPYSFWNFFSYLSSSPRILKKLFWTDLFSWMAVMAHNIYCTDFVAQVIYEGKPSEQSPSLNTSISALQEEDKFDEGVRMGSFGLLLHSITACLFVIFFLEKMTDLYGLKWTYFFGLMSYGVAMLVTAIFPNVLVLNICAAVSGIGFAIINCIPNTLITLYHEHEKLYFRETSSGGRVKWSEESEERLCDKTEAQSGKRGFGTDIALLDSSYLLAQTILATFMGILVDWTGKPHYYMLVAAVSSFVAAFLTKFVTFPD